MNFEISHKMENAENTAEKVEGRNYIESDGSMSVQNCNDFWKQKFDGVGEYSEGSEMTSEESNENEVLNEVAKVHEICPKTLITMSECEEFWNKMFSSEIPIDTTVSDVREGHKCYDDNGNLYRVGNELEPNCHYEINGYKYETDEKGRIISAEGDLHMKNREGRLPIKDSLEDIGKGDQKEGDDRGHLIGDQFDGSNGLENMIPQDAEVNRHDFMNFENELAKEVKAGNDVHCKIEPIYDGDSRRPTVIAVTYSINKEESIRIFPNEKEK